MIRPKLIVMAKAPIMGQAKTRLAADIGPVHAKRIYRAMTAKILRSVVSPRWDTILAVTPRYWMGRVFEWEGFDQYAQTSGSLSPRLLQAFSDKGPTVVIGTDSPQVNIADIKDAFKRLRSSAAVFGPANDGGFWLMGLNHSAHPKLFEKIRWSTRHTLSDVEAHIDGKVSYLRTLTDVDDAIALKRVKQSVRF